MIMKKTMLLSTVILLAFITSGYAQDSEMQVTFDLTYSTKYVWRGFNVFGAKTAIHPTLDLFCPSSGMGLSVEGHRANSSGYEIGERWDYSLYYLGKMFEGETFEMMYRLAYVYYNFPQQSAHSKGDNPIDSPATFSLACGTFDLQEGHVAMSFPKLLGVENLVPTYVLVKLWPSNSGTVVGAKSASGGTASGFAHIFMLDYKLPIVCPITGVDRKLNLHSEFVFNDGVAPTGANADHDWSNAVFGVSTDYELEDNITITPGFYYQSSWDDSVNSSDEYWSSLSLTGKF
jgi:hypothetical protein